MAQYIDKDALVAEIEKLIKKNELYLDENASDPVRFQKTGAKSVLCDLRHFLDILEAKEVDLKKEIQDKIYNHFYDLEGIAIAGTSIYATVNDMEHIARHFFELGLKAQKGE